MYLNVPPADFGVIVGKNATTLNMLREKCNDVTITVPRQSSLPGCKVTIEGTMEDCQKAKAEIEALLMTQITMSLSNDATTPVSASGYPAFANHDAETASMSSHGTTIKSTNDINSELDLVESIERLRQSGALSDEEFSIAKNKLFTNLMKKISRRGSNEDNAARKEYPPKGVASLQAGHVTHPHDWICPDCGNMNWHSRKVCNRCKTKKRKPTNIKRFIANVGASQRMASSCKQGCSPGDGDLATGKGWFPTTDDRQWYCMDAGSSRVVNGVVVKPADEMWITAFSVTTSADGSDWKPVDDSAVFQGCASNDDARTAMFLKPVICRYIKVHPTAWHNGVGLRCGLVLCAIDNANKLTTQTNEAIKESKQDREAAKLAAREKLEGFFTMHNPDKLANIDTILHYCEKYGMDYAQLYRKLEAKYANANDTPKVTNILVVDTCTAKTGRFRSDWKLLNVGQLKSAIAKHFDVPTEIQLLKTRAGLEIENDSSLCHDHDIESDCVLFLDHLIHTDQNENADADVIDIPTA